MSEEITITIPQQLLCQTRNIRNQEIIFKLPYLINLSKETIRRHSLCRSVHTAQLKATYRCARTALQFAITYYVEYKQQRLLSKLYTCVYINLHYILTKLNTVYLTEKVFSECSY